MLLCGQTIRNCWETLSEDQKEAIAENVQGIFKVMKKELKLENQLPPNDFKGDPTEVSNWCRRMILYFNNKRINNDWKKIEFTLEKIKRGKDRKR